MATRQPSPPVSSHYLSQTGLAIALTQALRALWPSLNVRDLPGTLPQFKVATTALTHRFSLASGSLASREFTRKRLEAGIRSNFTVPVATPPTPEQVDKAVSWATKDLWNGDLLAAPPADPQVVEALDTAQTNVEGAVEKLVLDTGRQTMTDAVQVDRQAHIFARETKPGCCYFCALMASRGATYLSAGSAGRDANEKFIGDGLAKFHNHCRCTIVPVFGKYEPTAHARQWDADYQALKDQLGRAPSLLDWRRHFDASQAS